MSGGQPGDIPSDNREVAGISLSRRTSAISVDLSKQPTGHTNELIRHIPKQDLRGTSSDMKETRHTWKLQVLLDYAKKLAGEGKSKAAQRLYLYVLKIADEHYGQSSARTGLILLDVLDFYEREGSAEEVRRIRQRIIRVFCHYMRS